MSGVGERVRVRFPQRDASLPQAGDKLCQSSKFIRHTNRITVRSKPLRPGLSFSNIFFKMFAPFKRFISPKNLISILCSKSFATLNQFHSFIHRKSVPVWLERHTHYTKINLQQTLILINDINPLFLDKTCQNYAGTVARTLEFLEEMSHIADLDTSLHLSTHFSADPFCLLFDPCVLIRNPVWP